MTSEQVQDLNDWMKHRGIPNVHEIIAQNFRKPHALQDDLQFNREGKSCYIQSNVMVSLSLMITYIKHLRYSGKTTYFGPFYYIQIDPQDYHEWCITPPEEEVHFQTPSKLGSPATPRSMATSQASESYITLTNFKKGIKRDASAYPIFKNERYYNTFIRHFKATAKAQGLNSLMDPNFTPGSDEYEKVCFRHCTDCLGGEICRRYSFAPKTMLEQVGKLQVLCLSPLLRSHFDASPVTKRIVMDGQKWEIKINEVSRQHVLWHDIENRKMSMWCNNISWFVFIH